MPPELAAVAARNGGPFTRRQALQAGYSASQIRQRLRSGEWIVLRRGIYVETALWAATDNDLPARHALAVAAAQLATARAAAGSHHSAAIVHGFELLTVPADCVSLTSERAAGSARGAVIPGSDSVAVPAGAGPAAVRIAAAALPTHHLARTRGVLLTSPTRTVVDLAREVSFREAVVAADSALNRQSTYASALRVVLLDCCGWPGVENAVRVVEFADKRAESVLESVARVVFHEAGLPRPRLQVLIGDSRSPLAEADFYWPEQRTIGLADGRIKYAAATSRYGRADDPYAEKRVRERLEDLGFQVVPFGWDDAWLRPRHLVDRFCRAFARNARR